MSITRLLARSLAWTALAASFLFLLSVTVLAQTTRLDVSYDVSREHASRPRSEEGLHENARRFPAMNTFSVEQTLGGWDKMQKDHFADGAAYDQIIVKR